MKLTVAKILATAFGFGYSPLYPGTAGTIPAAIAAWYLFPSGNGVAVAVTLFSILIGVWAANVSETEFGKDGKQICIDEVAGMWVSLLFVPVVWQYYLLGFVLFRVFDVWKPCPARQSEKLGGGIGVMADDVVVGIYVNIILQMLVLFEVWI